MAFQYPLFLVAGKYQWGQCDNAHCKSKGKRVVVRRKNPGAHGLDLKFQRDTTSVFEGAPKVFR
jgi:hypothetical protein